MKTRKQFHTILMVTFFIVTIIYTSYSQEIFRTLGRYEYAKFDGVWRD